MTRAITVHLVDTAPALRLIVVAAVAGAALLSLAGCGKKGEPSPPGPPSAVIYPRAFPPPP